MDGRDADKVTGEKPTDRQRSCRQMDRGDDDKSAKGRLAEGMARTGRENSKIRPKWQEPAGKLRKPTENVSSGLFSLNYQWLMTGNLMTCICLSLLL